MSGVDDTVDRLSMWMRLSARAVLLIWATWWMYFGLASGLGEALTPMALCFHIAVPGLICLLSTAIAWRWDAIGGIILVLEGAAVIAGYPLMTFSHLPLSTILWVLATLGLPPWVAGMLLLIREWRVGR
jgi:hypothetical protein